ncbi:Receptor like protein 42 [Vitis vinifera]|uniref:Receptor like protein 42 n=1 Tax=Vitis vinifera TaxID=29760 RepID=A0A438DQ42_VITVI|nr:Receptor like protein 42 [Vitis vinifera]
MGSHCAMIMRALPCFSSKQSFLIDEYASEDSYAYPKVATWKSHGEGSDCCSWDGVECDRETGHVIGLHLASSCLYGSINSSSTLFSLVHLRRLDLSDNDFNYSEIPHGVSQLSRLRSLNLSDSQFSGQIHRSFKTWLEKSGSKFDPLKETSSKPGNQSPKSFVSCWIGPIFTWSPYPAVLLDLSYNFFSGPIPSFLANLTTLTYLSLTSNNFSAGTLAWLESIDWSDPILAHEPHPIDRIISSGKQIRRISLLSYTSTNATLPKFKLLGLASCNLTEFPDFLQNQQELEVLILSTNKIHGPIPKWMWNISKETLEALFLSNNFLSGFSQVPDVLPWSRMSILELSSNMLQGSLPVPPSSTVEYQSLEIDWLEKFHL